MSDWQMWNDMTDTQRLVSWREACDQLAEARAEVKRLRAALVVAEDALANCYDVCEWPAQNGSKQLDALRTVRAAFPTTAP